MKWLLIPTCTLALLCASVQASRLSEYIASPELRAKLQEVYGGRAIQRAEAFSRLLSPRAGTTDQQKIELVNNYFNNLTYSEDPRLWGDDDYWANPLEFIGARGGDCEDYSIAKYYTLMELGVDEKKLRLAYVKAVKYNQWTRRRSPNKASQPLQREGSQLKSVSSQDRIVGTIADRSSRVGRCSGAVAFARSGRGRPRTSSDFWGDDSDASLALEPSG